MKNKDFREIQVSSSLLVAIFLGVLALGVFIFLLGVSVGKKQGRLSNPTQVVTQQIAEPVKEPSVKPINEETEPPPAVTPSTKEAADERATKTAPASSSVKAPAPKTATEIPKTAAAAKGLWYVQVLSTDNKAKAQAAADRYKKQGSSVLILNPQAGEKLYKVRLGGFASKTQAVDLKNRINAAEGGNKDYWVVKY